MSALQLAYSISLRKGELTPLPMCIPSKTNANERFRERTVRDHAGIINDERLFVEQRV